MHFYRYFSDTDTLFPDTVKSYKKMYLDTYLAHTRYDTPILWFCFFNVAVAGKAFLALCAVNFWTCPVHAGNYKTRAYKVKWNCHFLMEK